MNNSHLHIRMPQKATDKITAIAKAKGIAVSVLLRMIILEWLEYVESLK